MIAVIVVEIFVSQSERLLSANCSGIQALPTFLKTAINFTSADFENPPCFQKNKLVKV